MAILFAIVNPKEGKVIENIIGLYEDLPAMYEKAKSLILEDVTDFKICHMKDNAETDVLMNLSTFTEIMGNTYGEPNKEILSHIVTEQRNEDFIVAFLREFISPIEEPWGEDRKRFCQVLKICKEVFEEKELKVYADICNVGIGVYSSNDY